jgi:paraquat-inducible protein B
MPESENPLVPESNVVPRKKGSVSLVWLVPILAAAVGLWIAVTTIRNRGPEITIVFKSADGLEAGKTKIRYNGIDIGTVTTVHLSADHQKIVTIARMDPKTEPFLVKDTKFWVVRPRVSGATISGLGTLISGAYIGAEIGQSTERERNYEGLEDAPVETGGVHGRFFNLTTSALGSLDRGTPVFYRRLQAGQVVSYSLNKDGKSLDVQIFVQEPYVQFVHRDTRFWQASGVDVSLTASGLKVQTESFLSILIGGVAFESPDTDPAAPPAEPNTSFVLHTDRAAAFRPPARDPQTYVMVFKESVRGLSVGAPVEFRGIAIGEVTDIQARFDRETYTFSVPVTVKVDPERFGVEMLGDKQMSAGERLAMHRTIMENMVKRGLRTQLRTGSLVSGSLFISADLFPESAPATLDWSKSPAELPTIPGKLESLQNSLEGIVKKLDQLQLQQLLDDLHKTFGNVDQTLVGLQGTLTNADLMMVNASKIIAPNAPLENQLNSMLMEMGGAARSLRLLTDYLERHPESLIRGKAGEPK